MESTIVVKQRPHPDYAGLTVKHVESKEYMCPKTGRDGKLLTGIDENAYDIVSLEEPERTTQSKKVKKEREELERLLGVSLTPDSDFWSKFYIVLEDEQKFDALNPRDRLLIHFLTANKYVAPSLDEAEEDDQYRNCLFYLYKKEAEISKSASKKKTLVKATAKLYELENLPDKLKTVAGYIFGYDPKTDLTAEEAYLKLTEYLEDCDDKDKYTRATVFVDVVSKTQEELMVKVILDKAINKHAIKLRGGTYKRGDITLGESYDEALEYLTDPSNSADLVSLTKEVSLKETSRGKK